MLRRTSGLSKEEIRANYNACDSGITLSMKICASYRWVTQDVRLNHLYKQSLEKARELSYEKSLIRAQRAWLAYRDATCAYEGEMGAGGGTAEGLYVLSCKEDLTKERADRLEAALRQ
jgi:uncharacterized protein YecT (DUF1311 family)